MRGKRPHRPGWGPSPVTDALRALAKKIRLGKRVLGEEFEDLAVQLDQPGAAAELRTMAERIARGEQLDEEDLLNLADRIDTAISPIGVIYPVDGE